jgi:hypothetical protein
MTQHPGTISEKCIEQVWESGGWHKHQCNRKRMEGSLYCKQHDPATLAAKYAERNAEFERKYAIEKKDRMLRNAAPDLLEALKALVGVGARLCRDDNDMAVLTAAIAALSKATEEDK